MVLVAWTAGVWSCYDGIRFFSKSPWSSEVRDNYTISLHRVQLRATYAMHVGTYSYFPPAMNGMWFVTPIVRTKLLQLQKYELNKDLVAPGPNGMKQTNDSREEAP